MIVTFDVDKSNVLFLHETPKEYIALGKFPAFIRKEISYAAPAVLPVVFNIVSRLQASFRNVKLSKEVETWLQSDFKLLDIPEDFKFITKPLDFQLIALRFLYTLGSAGVLLDPGMGKSKVILDYIALKRFKRSIVVCPAPLLFVWEDEINKHRPDLSYYVVTSTDWEQEIPKFKDKDVIIINYNKAVIMEKELKAVQFDFMYVDEFLIKDIKTERTNSLTRLSRGIPYKSGGSGTLINNSPIDAYAPLRFLCPALVGGNYQNFTDKFLIKVKNKNDPQARPIVVGFRGHAEIKTMLESCCIVMTKERWLKLPPKRFHDRFVQMGQEQKDAYYGLLRNYFANILGKNVEIDNPLVMLSKLYQISQGFIYINKEQPLDIERDLLADEVPSTKKRASKADREVLYFDEQPKIEELEKLLTTTLSSKKSIIWYNLDGELKLIEDLLNKLGDTYFTIRGGDKKIGEKVRTFNKTPSIKRLVCQAKAVNYGITVLGTKLKDLDDDTVELFPNIDPTVSNQVFYSLNFSLEVYLQQQDRIHRLGQENECNYYRIFANNPVERKIRDIIEDKVILKKTMLVDVMDTLLSDREAIQ